MQMYRSMGGYGGTPNWMQNSRSRASPLCKNKRREQSRRSKPKHGGSVSRHLGPSRLSIQWFGMKLLRFRRMVEGLRRGLPTGHHVLNFVEIACAHESLVLDRLITFFFQAELLLLQL